MSIEAQPIAAQAARGAATPATLPDGLVAVVKRDCPTCQLVEPVLGEIVRRGRALVVVSQDDPSFPAAPAPIADRGYAWSIALSIEAVPTLLRLERGAEVGRVAGWHRERWQQLAQLPELGADLPAARPGCGSAHLDPAHAEQLDAARAGGLRARPIALGEDEDPIEACFARGFSDGLPVVPPTERRVLRMLEGSTRPAGEVVALLAPDYAECTVEKVAINAVMAGCLPEYLPVVLAAVEAAAAPEFNWHGLAATTYFAGPVVIVNGPIRRALGMNSGMNVLGQGNRANSTIGRALNLVLRNVGGARPGEVDRATLGNPGKLSFCFPEDEEGSPWPSLAAERGIPAGASAVTLFAGEAPRGVVDQLSRQPESLARSLAGCLQTVAHPKLAHGYDAQVVNSPEHARVFHQEGWSKARLREELLRLLTGPGRDLVRGAGGCAEGLPAQLAGADVPKFRPDGLWLVHAGGTAGLFSAIIGSWVNGDMGSRPVTRTIQG